MNGQQLLLPPLSKQKTVKFDYLHVDTFESGSLGSPRTSDLGYMGADNAGAAVSIADGALTVNGTLASSERVFSATSDNVEVDYGRVLGRVFSFKVFNRMAIPSVQARFGFGPLGANNSNTIGFDYLFSIGVDRIRVKQGVGVLRTVILGTNAHRFACIMGDLHSKLVAENYGSRPKLVWVYTTTATANSARIYLGADFHEFKVDDWKVFDSHLYTDDYSDARIKNIVPVNSQVLLGENEGIYHLSFTLPSAPSANMVAVELRYRQADALNYWSLRIVRNAENTAWDLLLVKVVAGVPSTSKTVTGVATPTRLIAIAESNTHESWTDASGVSTLRGATITDATHSTNAGVSAVWDAATIIGRLSVWAVYNPFYNPLFPVGSAPVFKNIAAIGDSKTLINPGTYGRLIATLNTASSSIWSVDRVAIGAFTVKGWLDNGMAAEVAAYPQTPSYILINLGVNDLNAGATAFYFKRDGTGQVWVDDYKTLIGLWQARFPGVPIYLAQIWRDGAEYAADIALMNDTLIPQIISETSNTFLGIDERTFLPSNNVDGIHPDGNGHILAAQAWKTLLL